MFICIDTVDHESIEIFVEFFRIIYSLHYIILNHCTICISRSDTVIINYRKYRKYLSEFLNSISEINCETLE